jgi:hypothetical protein
VNVDGSIANISKQTVVPSRDARGNLKYSYRKENVTPSDRVSVQTIRSKHVRLTPDEKLNDMNVSIKRFTSRFTSLRQRYSDNVLAQMKPVDRMRVQNYLQSLSAKIQGLKQNQMQELAKKEGVSEYSRLRDEKLEQILNKLNSLQSSTLPPPVSHPPSKSDGCHVNITMK